MIPDKQGRLVDIDERPSGWKLTPRQRDEIYQQFLEEFPDRDCDADPARAWITLQAKQAHVSPKRVRDFIGEAIAAERGLLDRSWAWWVNCSRSSKPTKSQS